MPVQHRLIIRHPLQAAILVVNDHGGPRLPAFTADDRHTAEVDYINAAIRERFGLLTTVLQSLHHSDSHDGVVVRVHELETHGESALRSPTLRWCGQANLWSLLDGEDQAAIAEWQVNSSLHHAVVDGREWTRPGWLDAVGNWIERALREAGLGPVQDISQLRAWPSSCVLHVRAVHADYYFKAVPESLRQECAVTRYLAHHFPGAVPQIIATEPERRWLLMTACTGRKLEEVTAIALWERAASRYAHLQAACVSHVQALRAQGCPLRSLDALAQEIAPICHDTAVLRPGTADGLASAEIKRLQALVPELQRRCAQLAGWGIPRTIEHGDLWPGNVLVDRDTCVIIDWEDVAIAHPFLSLAPLSVGLRACGLHSPGILNRLEGAYLSAFTEFAAPERLRTALHLAAPLCFIDMAVRYVHQAPSVVRLHPWMRDLVPQTLRLALAYIT